MAAASGCGAAPRTEPATPASAASAATSATTSAPLQPPKVLLDENFDGSQLVAPFRAMRTGLDVETVNQEAAVYRPAAATVAGGSLQLTATSDLTSSTPFTSAMVTTAGTFAFRYGTLDVWAELPAGKGLWPAIWLLETGCTARPAPCAGHGSVGHREVDLVETRGSDPRTVISSYHYDGEGPADSIALRGPDTSIGIHRFTLTWTPGQLRFAIDNQEIGTIAAAPDQPMFLLIDLAVGGRFDGVPDTTTTFPAIARIDRVLITDDTHSDS